MKDTLIVIPARFKSERFPGKVLAVLRGKPVLQWVYETCKQAKTGKVIIATDNKKVKNACNIFRADCVMTSPKCKSGTDRVWLVAKKYPHKYIINVQADMPLINIQTIRNVCRKIKTLSEADIVSAYCVLTKSSEIENTNNVKVVITNKGRALYFSRAAIPCYERSDTQKIYYKHYGIYAFKRKSLEKFVKTSPSRLEITEKLEQLRALEAGMNIYCIKTSCQGYTVDTLEDFKKAEKMLKIP